MHIYKYRIEKILFNDKLLVYIPIVIIYDGGIEVLRKTLFDNDKPIYIRIVDELHEEPESLGYQILSREDALNVINKYKATIETTKCYTIISKNTEFIT